MTDTRIGHDIPSPLVIRQDNTGILGGRRIIKWQQHTLIALGVIGIPAVSIGLLRLGDHQNWWSVEGLSNLSQINALTIMSLGGALSLTIGIIKLIKAHQSGNPPTINHPSRQTREDATRTEENRTITLTQDLFITALTEWKQTEAALGNERNAKTAYDRILNAWQNNETSLELDYLQLTTLPPLIGNLTALQHLHLNNNQITSIPAAIGNLIALRRLELHNNQITSILPEIGNLTVLRDLSLSSNRITSIPAEIGNLTVLRNLSLHNNQITSIPTTIGNLTALLSLNLHNNRITSIPTQIGNLTVLQRLYLYNNQITSIPTQIGNLTVLRSLSLYNNQITSIPIEIGHLTILQALSLHNNLSLAELPLSLGNCGNITHIDILQTAISQISIDAILGLCRAKRDRQGAALLPQRINAWKSYGGHTPEFDLSTLDENQKIQLNEWLLRLEKTHDFARCQKRLAKIVCNILETGLNDSNFKETFFNQISANLEGCDDRAAMSLNEIYTSWKLNTMAENAPLQEKIQLLVGIAKTITLRTLLAQKIHVYTNGQGMGESVEVFLYYEMLFKDLRLVSIIQHNHYADSMGKCSWINEVALRKEIEESYMDTLLEIPALQNIRELQEVLEPIRAPFAEAMEQLEEEKGQMQDAVFQQRMNAILAERQTALNAATQVFILHSYSPYA